MHSDYNDTVPMNFGEAVVWGLKFLISSPLLIGILALIAINIFLDWLFQ